MAQRPVDVTIRFSDDGTTRVLDQAGKELKNLGKRTDDTRSSFSKFSATLITVNQGVQLLQTGFRAFSRVARSIGGVIQDVTQFAAQQELAVTKLNAALQSTGQFTRSYSRELQELAKQFQNTTRFGDETILSVEQQLIAFGGARSQMKQMTGAVLDLAAGMNIDLRSAVLLLGKALAGEFSTLSRYGIFVDKNADATTKMDQALKQIQQRFGGQAAAEATTYAGVLSQLTNIWGDMKEAVGRIFTESRSFRIELIALQEVIGNTTGEIDEWNAEGDHLQGLLPAITQGALTFGKAMLLVADALLTAFKPLIAVVEGTANLFNKLVELNNFLAQSKASFLFPGIEEVEKLGAGNAAIEALKAKMVEFGDALKDADQRSREFTAGLREMLSQAQSTEADAAFTGHIQQLRELVSFADKNQIFVPQDLKDQIKELAASIGLVGEKERELGDNSTKAADALGALRSQVLQLDLAQAQALAKQTGDFTQFHDLRLRQIKSELDADLKAVADGKAGQEARALAFEKAALRIKALDEQVYQAGKKLRDKELQERKQGLDAILALEKELSRALMTEQERQLDTLKDNLEKQQEQIKKAREKGFIDPDKERELLAKSEVAHQSAVDNIKNTYLDLGQVIRDTIGQMVDAWINGTLDIENAMDALERAGKGIIAKMFKGILDDKIKFDDTFKVNFLKDIPGFIKEGLGKGAGFFSSFFSKIPGLGSLFSGGGAQNAAGAQGGGVGAAGAVGAGGVGGIAAIVALGVAGGLTKGFDTIDKEPFGFRTFEGREKFMRDFARGFLSTFGIKIGKAQGEFLTKFSIPASLNRILSGEPGPQEFISAPVLGGLSKLFGINVFGKGPTLGTQFRESAVSTLKDADVVFANELSRKKFGLKSAKAWAKLHGRNLEEGLANFVERDAPELYDKFGKKIFALGAIFTAAGLGVGSKQRGKFGDVKPQRGLSSFANMVAEAFGGDLDKAQAFVQDAVGKLELTLTDAARSISDLFPLFTAEGLAKTTFDPNGPEFDNLVAGFQKNFKDAIEGVVQLFGEIPNEIVAAATAQEIWNRAIEQGGISAKEIERIIISAKASFETLAAGIRVAFNTAMETGDKEAAFDAFAEAVQKTVKDAVITGLIEAFIQGAAMQNILQPFYEQLNITTAALAAGDITPQEAAKQIRDAWADAKGKLDEMKPVIDAIADAGIDIADIFGGDMADGISNATDKAKELQATLDAVQLAQANFNTNLTSRIAELRGDDIGAIRARVPQPAQRFLVVKQQFIEGGTFDEQTARLQEMNDLLEQLLDLRIQEIQADFAARKEAVQADFEARRDVVQARIDALNDERDAINSAADAAIQARQEELDLVREWVSILSSADRAIDRLKGGALSPDSPLQQMQGFLAEFRQLATQGGTQEERQAAARRLVELGPMILQLAQQAGIGAGSAQFISLWQEILSVLDRVKDNAQAGADRAETLQQEIRDLNQERNDKLAAIDDKIASQQDILTQLSKDEQATLERLSKDEQAAINDAKLEVANVLEWIQGQGNITFEEWQNQLHQDLVDLKGSLGGSSSTTFDANQQWFDRVVANIRDVQQSGLGAQHEWAQAVDKLLGITNDQSIGVTSAQELEQFISNSLGTNGIDQFLLDLLQGFMFAFPNVTQLGDLATVLRQAFSAAAFNAGTPLFGFAKGGTGVVTGPKTFLAGEAGPEAFAFGPLGTPLGDAIIALGKTPGVGMPPSTPPPGQPVGFAGTTVSIGKIEQRNDVQIDGNFDLQNDPGEVKRALKTVMREGLIEALADPEVRKRLAKAVKTENAGVA